MKLLPLLVACVLAAGACRNHPSSEQGEGTAGAGSTRIGPAPVVTGTVLDARTGKPIADALVRGPGGVEAKSDARGRFVLRGLALGVSGDLIGTTDSGLSGRNRLRELQGGPLEVVLHLH